MNHVSRPCLPVIAMLCALLLLLTVSGCEGTKTSDRDLSFVDADRGLELVRERKPLLGDVQKGIWVDPRVKREFEKGHIPGAISLPFQYVSDEHYRLRDYDVIVVYGDDYNDPKANGMSKKLIELGYKNVKTLRGGLRAWKDAGYELETGVGDAAGATP